MLSSIRFGSIRLNSISTRFAMAIIAILAMSVTAFAQEETITIDTDVLFSSINTWITNLLPVIAIGAGIGIAIAILMFVVTQIGKAFPKSGK